MKIWNKEEIIAKFDIDRATNLIEKGFVAYSKKAVLVPPVQNFYFKTANGDCCIKSAYVEGSENFAVKVSAGFYNNSSIGLPSNSGLVMIFSAKTGLPVALLKDEGWLTGVRTAIAGQLVARILAPRVVKGIGVIGTGDQARLQLEYLKSVTTCREVHVWGPDAQQGERFVTVMTAQGFTVHLHKSPEPVARNANLIVTATPSREALLKSEWISAGTHITAVGADSQGKQELDPQIVARAGVIVVDSIEQCSKYGEVSHAVDAGLIQLDMLKELGNVLSQGGRARDDVNEMQITIADLTGVAVQDAQIAESVVS
ncbi:ornithine cyclodeaminase family protein [Aquitalea sp. LB_tupeE]|uniref:ornithine cyclodeaminase family protein n=1 Tax=Aquitalea sp. LB_tupeE TaxID=2748078 RepID=UPI0015BCB669|nr:ornithine cyclodeaminase family protein [Aquitalea sp. LB_tupeE]NWK80200.1 ornithine cyclodeaminase family protein [Aquitalea sp. LB_tupeE]